MERHRHHLNIAPDPHNKRTSNCPHAACLVCGGGGLVPAAGYSGLVRCAACGFLSVGRELSSDAAKALYDGDYFHGQEYLDYRMEETALRRNFRKRLETILSVLPDAGSRHLFEIGCAYGYFLDEARKHFKSVAGIDISDAAAEFARGRLAASVVAGDYLDYELPGPVDAICLWDVIEHLSRPDRVLEKAARDLRSGGIVCITTGDVGSLNARLRKSRWRMIHPPTHLHYFSVPTLTKLLARHGFDVVYVSHPGVSRSLGMIIFGLLSFGLGRPDLYAKLPRLEFLNLDIPLNLFDIMFVIARKPEK